MNFGNLENIRNELVRLEDSIIYALIERCQFAHNKPVYTQNTFPDLNGKSFLEYFLHEIECAHAKVRRYASPDEHPFTNDLPDAILPPLRYPKLLIPNTINVNVKIFQQYTEAVVGLLTACGDDGNYGSSATKDAEALQLLSRRIHFGKFVAEAKFNGPQHDSYVGFIRSGNREALECLLTDRAVEEKLLRRLKRKAEIYGAEISDSGSLELVSAANGKRMIDVDAIVGLYRDIVIPLTKLVEVDYLCIRLEYPDFVPEECQKMLGDSLV